MRVSKKMSHNRSHIHTCNAQQCKAVQCKANQSIDHDLDDDSDSADDDDDDVDDDSDGKVGRNDKQCKALGGLQSNAMQCKAIRVEDCPEVCPDLGRCLGSSKVPRRFS